MGGRDKQGMLSLQHVIFLDGGRFVPAKDGMDQAKWSVPRGRQNRLTKSEMPLVKPRFKIEGCWILGLHLGRNKISQGSHAAEISHSASLGSTTRFYTCGCYHQEWPAMHRW